MNVIVNRAVTLLHLLRIPADGAQTPLDSPTVLFYKHYWAFLRIEMALGPLFKSQKSHHYIMLFLDYAIRYVKAFYKGYMNKRDCNAV